MSSTESAPGKLFQATLSRLKAELDLHEISREPGGEFHVLESFAPFHDGRCGEVRLFESDRIGRVVSVSLVAPAISLDTHMVFAFTPPESPVPHFTLDSVMAGENFAFHLDLIPKVDLGVNLPYLNWAFAPLNEAYEASYEIEGLTRAKITPVQHAVMSPWMLVHRADLSAFESIGPLVNRYFDHWLALLNGEVPAEVRESLEGVDVAARDAANRNLIFDPDVDKVWNQIKGLIGERSVETIRHLLKNGEI